MHSHLVLLSKLRIQLSQCAQPSLSEPAFASSFLYGGVWYACKSEAELIEKNADDGQRKPPEPFLGGVWQRDIP